MPRSNRLDRGAHAAASRLFNVVQNPVRSFEVTGQNEQVASARCTIPNAKRARVEPDSYLFTADAGVGAGQKRPPRLSYSACSGPGGSRFANWANWANGLNGLRASWVD